MRDESKAILAICAELSFAAAGVADASPTKWGEELKAWLAAGKHGSMEYLARGLAARLDPGLVLAGARSVIMVADVYAARGEVDEVERGMKGRVARYARGRDYHVVIKKRLHALCDRLRGEYPGAEFRAFVDTAPVLEREYAARAGLGWVGKHTLLIHPRLGSYMLLGGVFTTLKLKASGEVVSDHCGTCTRCIEACPTSAITPYSVDASRCVSYLTIERRLPVDAGFHEGMGEWIFGCDVCQEVCPHNSARPEGVDVGAVQGEYTARRGGFDLLSVLGWTEADRARAFQGSALKRATLAMMKRNALIAAGNVLARRRDEALLARVREIGGDAAEAEMVRETAREVMRRLEPGA